MKTKVEYPRMSAGIVKVLLGRGMTQSHLAKLLGVSKSFISRVHAGQRSLTLDHLAKLEQVTGESMPLLFLRATPLERVPRELRPLYRAAVKLCSPRGTQQKPRVGAKAA